jgi:predicted TPR repeat methyltransferase/thioredoxin-like negative regulator of GroEL
MLRAGRISAVRPLLAALRRASPGASDAVELEARVLQHDGRRDEARAVLDAGLDAAPDDVRLRISRAELRLIMGEALGAADDAAAAVIADPGDASAKAMLGMALIRLERFDEAASCLREAVAAAPRHPGFRAAYAHALDAMSQFAGTAATLSDGIAAVPSSVELRVAAIVNALRRGQPREASEIAQAARRDGIADARVFELLGHALGMLGDDSAAAEAYADALKLGPEDAYLRYLAAASAWDSGTCASTAATAGVARNSAGIIDRRSVAEAFVTTDRAPAEFLRHVFDEFATQYERHQIAQGTRLPGIIRKAVLAHVPHLADGVPFGPVLDLGCGTGLVGVALSDLPVRGLAGVDISAGMLAQAEAKGIYDALRHADMAAILAGGAPSTAAWFAHAPASPADGQCRGTVSREDIQCVGDACFADGWGLIVAADSLCYFGTLDATLADAFEALRPGGVMIFSLDEWHGRSSDADETAAAETGAGNNAVMWRKAALGRYAHDIQSVADLAARIGFELRGLHRETFRQERGVRVDGAIFVLARMR